MEYVLYFLIYRYTQVLIMPTNMIGENLQIFDNYAECLVRLPFYYGLTEEE